MLNNYNESYADFQIRMQRRKAAVNTVLALALIVALCMLLLWLGFLVGRHDARETGPVSQSSVRTVFHEKLLRQIIFLESSGRHTGVWGDGHLSYGIAQFRESTFNYLKAKSGMEWLNWMSREDQITLLSWALDHNYGRFWSTYRTAYQRTVKAMVANESTIST